MNFISRNAPPITFENPKNFSPEEIDAAIVLQSLSEKDFVNTKKNLEICKIQEFINFLRENLNKETYEIQRQQLFSIRNFIVGDSNHYKWKERVFAILENVQEKDLDNLRKLSKTKDCSQFFEEISDLAKIYSPGQENEIIKKVKFLLDSQVDVYQVVNVFEKILPLKNLELERESVIIICDLFKLLGKKNNHDKAIEITNKIFELDKARKYSQIKDTFFECISKKLIEKEDLNKGRQVAAMISDLGRKTEIFSQIAILREDLRFKKIVISEPIDFSYGPLILKKAFRHKIEPTFPRKNLVN